MDSVVFIKVVSAALYPLGLVTVFGVVALYSGARGRQGRAKVCACISILVLLISSNPMFARFLVGELESRYPQKAIDEIAAHQAIIVLGGGLRVPSEPGQSLQLGSGADRYWHAAQLYFAQKAPLIIIAGGNVYHRPDVQGEAFYVAELLGKWGVPASAIIAETDSRTTAENAVNVQKILDRQGIDRALLVTSAIHMPRAYSLFEALPSSITPAVADVQIQPRVAPPVFSYLPSASALKMTTLAMHEYYGQWFNQIKLAIRRLN